MQTFLIVMGSLVTSSLLWITPLLLMDRNKSDEDEMEQQTSQHDSAENQKEEKVYSDEELEEVDLKSFYTFDLVDEMINVALANKIVSKEISMEYAFSIN